MSDLWLAPEEVAELTCRTRWTAQCRKLAEMGVPFTPNAAGRPLVERTAVVRDQPKPKARKGPNWDAIGRAA